MINILKIVKEEVSKFDFLSNDRFLKEQEANELLLNEDLQKQFICDSLLNKNNVKVLKKTESYVSGNWEIGDNNNISLEYAIDIAYLYDSTKEPVKFNILFKGDNIYANVDGKEDVGNYHNEPQTDKWFDSFEWNDIFVSMWNMEGDEIKFIAFDNAPSRIQTLLIRHFIQNYIESESLPIRTSEMKDNIRNISYC
jgi:hypothetical protein